jgi:hypothetical protein
LLVLQQPLRIQGSTERVAGRVEGGREGIPDHLKDIALLRLNGSVQDFVMARKQAGHFLRILLCQFRTALNIGKKKSYCTGGERYTASKVDD